MRPTRLSILAIAWCAYCVLVSHLYSSPSSFSRSSDPHSLSLSSSPLFVSGQIIRSALTDLDRAREEALQAGRLRDLAALRRHSRTRREDLLPAPAHVVVTPDGTQELYQPDREKHIRIPGRRPYPPNHPHSGSIKVPRRRRGLDKRQIPATARTQQAAQQQGSQQQEAGATRKAKRLRGKTTGRQGQTTTDLHASTPPKQSIQNPQPSSSSSPSSQPPSDPEVDPLNVVDESGHVFPLSKLTAEQRAALRAVDEGFSPFAAKEEGYLATVVDAIIDPHSVIARPSNESARGVMIIVLVPLLCIFLAFCTYALYIYKRRTELEESLAQHNNQGINARRKKQVENTIKNVDGSAPIQPQSNYKKPPAKQKPNEDADWEVMQHSSDDDL